MTINTCANTNCNGQSDQMTRLQVGMLLFRICRHCLDRVNGLRDKDDNEVIGVVRRPGIRISPNCDTITLND